MTHRQYPVLALLTMLGAGAIGMPAAADESDLLRRIERQQQTIDAQDDRIDRLERLIETLVQEPAPVPAPVADPAPAPPSTQDPAPVATSDQPTAQERGEDDPFAGVAAAKVKGYNPERSFFGPLPRLRSDYGQYSFGIGGLLQTDAGIYSQNAQGPAAQSLAGDLGSGTNFRRAILFVNGVFLKDWIWAMVYDLADTGETVIEGLRTAMVIYRGLGPWWILIGQQNTGIGLDASTFSTTRTFMEDAQHTGSFAASPGSPAIGVATLYRENSQFIRLGLLGEPAESTGTGDEGWGIHARYAWAPVAERTRALHLGISGYWRKPGGIGYASDPELRIDNALLVDTGQISRVDDYYHVGLEAALVHGPYSIQGEYGYVGVNRKNSAIEPAFGDLGFNGYYVQASYFLTGESRNYYPRFAAFWRVNPKNDFSLSKGTWGAWEVGVRYSTLDLDDDIDNLAGGGVRGGVAENFTFGVNWYLNAFVRAQLNYVHADVDNLSDTGLSEGEVFDAIAARMQVEW